MSLNSIRPAESIRIVDWNGLFAAPSDTQRAPASQLGGQQAAMAMLISLTPPPVAAAHSPVVHRVTHNVNVSALADNNNFNYRH